MKLVDFPISSITSDVANYAERVAINPQEVESVVKCGDDTNINTRSGDTFRVAVSFNNVLSDLTQP